MKYTRREFLKTTSNTLIVTSLAKSGWSVSKGMPQREFGKTGEGLPSGTGGHHIGQIRDDRESIALIREAIDLGVTFMDNAGSTITGDRKSLMGRALQDGYREKVFLMTKHHGRDRKTAMQHLEDSLRRLKTDVIDLWQFHEVVYDEDPRMILPKTEALAAERSKKQGKVRYIGFTGHKNPDHFKAMLNYDFQWDAVHAPKRTGCAFPQFQKNILPILTERGLLLWR